MKIAIILSGVLLPMLPAAERSPSVQAAPNRPNIVFILADDLGLGDTKIYGGDRCQIETPNIDALARGGLRFTDAHPSASVCRPTRQAIMTGRYNWRFGSPVTNGPWGFCGPRPGSEKSTLAKVLQRSGYHTGYVGKWHLGTTMTTLDGQTQGPANVDFTQPLIYGPQQFGFEESFILPGSLDMFPYVFARNHEWQGEVTAQKGWSAFNRVGPAADDFEDHEVLETFYTEAEDYLMKRSGEQPFFLFLALTAPHTPTSPGIKWRGQSKLGVYGYFVMEVDHAVERVMDTLKRQGLDQNTLVIFSSDHGAAPYAGNILKATPGQIHLLEEKGHYASGPHRGFKFSVYEGGLRVPLIAHWPAAIEAGRTSDALVGLNDLMATLAELSGTSLNAEEGPDSVSFASVLRDADSESPRRHLLMQSAQEVFVVRDGDWKLCLGPGSGAKDLHLIEPLSSVSWTNALADFTPPLDRQKLTKSPFVQLFNLASDPHEDHNLAAEYPAQIGAMVALLEQNIKAGRSNPGPALTNDRRVLIHQRLPDVVKQQLRP
jgi:arylsulfatase A